MTQAVTASHRIGHAWQMTAGRFIIPKDNPRGETPAGYFKAESKTKDLDPFQPFTTN